MSDKVYEMLWDCQFCGTKGNLGLTHRHCPSCGAPQNPDSRYYPSDSDKVAVEDHQFTGADITCPACGQLNGAASGYCGQCGSPLSGGKEADTLGEERRGEGAFESSGSRDVVKERFDREMERVGVTNKNKPGGIPKKFIAIGLIVIGLIVAIIVALTWTKEATLIVTGHEWQRTIELQEYKDFTTRDWRDSRPSGDNVSIVFGSCREEQRSTRRVEDGQSCETVRRDNGDGTYSEERECTTTYREEPVYDDKCTWEGQRWENITDAVASGTLSETPQWPAISLQCEGQSRVGCQREKERKESYEILFQDEEDEDYRCEFPQQEWQEIPLESLWKAQVSVMISGSMDCDTLVRQ